MREIVDIHIEKDRLPVIEYRHQSHKNTHKVEYGSDTIDDELIDALVKSYVELRLNLAHSEKMCAQAEESRAGLQAHNEKLMDEQMTLKKERDGVKEEIDKLAEYIMEEVDGEPSANEGACDTAIRVMRALDTELATLGEELAQAVKDCNAAWRDMSYASEARAMTVARDNWVAMHNRLLGEVQEVWKKAKASYDHPPPSRVDEEDEDDPAREAWAYIESHLPQVLKGHIKDHDIEVKK